jgi:predicted RNA binding protein YcfA (HicA-like mRNA interferase family)
VAKEEKASDVINRLKHAGFVRITTDGRHSKWQHPSGAWVPVPDSHRTISSGVVRKINNAIKESEGK